MLHAVGQLSQHVVGNIGRALADEVDADRLGADQLDHLDDLLHQGLGHIGKEQVGLVKEEDHPGLVEIANLGQVLKQFRQHPEQEGGIDRGALNQLLAGEDVDVAPTVGVGVHPVHDVQLRLTEELLSALVLEGEQGALDGADAGGGDIAVLHGKLGAILAHKLEHGSQILQVQQQEAIVVSHLEDDVQNAGLDLGQAEESRQQHGAHGADRDTHGVAHFPENIPEAGGIAVEAEAVDAEARDPVLHVGSVLAWPAHAGQIALDIRQEHRNAHIRKGLRHDLHGDRFAGAGRAGNETVTVCHIGQQEKPLIRLGHPDFVFFIHGSAPLYVVVVIS